MTITKTIATAMSASALLCSSAHIASAQNFDERPLRLVVPFGSGSGTDQQARGLAQALTEIYGINVVVENKPGASGQIGAQDAANSEPDGHTVFVATNTTQAANQHLFRNLPYDPVESFTPVTPLARGAMLMVVNAESDFETVQDVIDYGRENPGDLTFGEGSASSRVGGEMFKQLTEIDMLHVPYPSNPNAHVDLMGGRIDVVFSDFASTIGHVRGGGLRALGFTGSSRTDAMPDLPTVAESGVEGYDVSFWFATYLPAGATDEVVENLHSMITEANSHPIMENIREISATDVFMSSPEELAEFQAEETKRWGEVIRAAGIEPE